MREREREREREMTQHWVYSKSCTLLVHIPRQKTGGHWLELGHWSLNNGMRCKY